MLPIDQQVPTMCLATLNLVGNRVKVKKHNCYLSITGRAIRTMRQTYLKEEQ